LHQYKFPSQSGNKPAEKEREREEEPKKGPLQCWGCGETHMLRDCPHRQHDIKNVYNVQGEDMANDVSIRVSRIYVVVENRQEYHKYFVVELEGIISNQPISISIDPSSNLSYISPQFFEACSLQRNKHAR
jgi:hypothetical protein